MRYLMTAKNGDQKKVVDADEDRALRILRGAALGLRSQDETSADLFALKVLNDTRRIAQVIKHPTNGSILIIQRKNDL